MPIYQARNGDLDDLRQPDQHSYERILTEPLGGFGVWNGQFEQGPDGQYPGMENWVAEVNAGCTIARSTAAPFTGAHCVRATSGAGNAPGLLYTNRLYPVHDTALRYYANCAARGSIAAATVRFQIWCYTAAKAYIALATMYAAAPGVNWVSIPGTIGAGGAVAFAANTRWVRVGFRFDDTNAGRWIEVDNVWFWPVLTV